MTSNIEKSSEKESRENEVDEVTIATSHVRKMQKKDLSPLFNQSWDLQELLKMQIAKIEASEQVNEINPRIEVFIESVNEISSQDNKCNNAFYLLQAYKSDLSQEYQEDPHEHLRRLAFIQCRDSQEMSF